MVFDGGGLWSTTLRLDFLTENLKVEYNFEAAKGAIQVGFTIMEKCTLASTTPSPMEPCAGKCGLVML